MKTNSLIMTILLWVSMWLGCPKVLRCAKCGRRNLMIVWLNTPCDRRVCWDCSLLDGVVKCAIARLQKSGDRTL